MNPLLEPGVGWRGFQRPAHPPQKGGLRKFGDSSPFGLTSPFLGGGEHGPPLGHRRLTGLGQGHDGGGTQKKKIGTG